MDDNLKAIVLRHLDYCHANDWEGHDPYDALNSGVFRAFPFLDFRFFRLGLTQALKRLPFNLRPLLLVPKTHNPKGLALFLTAMVELSKHGMADRCGPLQVELADKLIALRSTGSSSWCWGYSFPWQTRTVLVARGEPNLVCTTFVANALLDAYEHTRDPRYLQIATSAADYILEELYWTEDDRVAGFAYPLPTSRARVHNANFLGAALLARIYRFTADPKFLAPALKVARYSAGKQASDGSWEYGELSTQRWIDNFHTGFNLCALRAIGKLAGISDFEGNLRRGFNFYCTHFFRDDGAPRYFHDRTYPIDIHSVAQSIITLVELRDLDSRSVPLAKSVLRWAMTHMWDDRGYYYYRVLRLGTIKTSYMRWSQAWMLLALAKLHAIHDDAATESTASVLQL